MTSICCPITQSQPLLSNQHLSQLKHFAIIPQPAKMPLWKPTCKQKSSWSKIQILHLPTCMGYTYLSIFYFLFWIYSLNRCLNVCLRSLSHVPVNCIKSQIMNKSASRALMCPPWHILLQRVSWTNGCNQQNASKCTWRLKLSDLHIVIFGLINRLITLCLTQRTSGVPVICPDETLEADPHRLERWC